MGTLKLSRTSWPMVRDVAHLPGGQRTLARSEDADSNFGMWRAVEMARGTERARNDHNIVSKWQNSHNRNLLSRWGMRYETLKLGDAAGRAAKQSCVQSRSGMRM
jgi:hypothetical protein